MKSIFRVNPVTYFLLLSVLLCGYFNYFVVIFVILFFHEIGHLMMIWLFGEKIKMVEILPFGALIKMDMQMNISSVKLLLISSFGIVMQLFLYIPFMYLYNNGLINDLTYKIFLIYNRLIILFNVIPVIPLDGSKIFGSILELIMPYKLHLKIVNIISVLGIVIFFSMSDFNLSFVVIECFLVMETLKLIRNHNYLFNNFLLERYLYKIEHKRVKRVRCINQIYKNYYNFINNIRERDVLSAKFKPFN